MKSITVFLILALALLPVRAGEQPPQKDLLAECVIAVVVIAVGVVVVYGIIKMCRKIPAFPPPNPPPATNAPNSLTLELATTNSYFTLQGSPSLGGWSNLASFTLTVSNGVIFCRADGYSNSLPVGAAVFFLPALPPQPQSAGFFRLLSK